jgi:HEPN domain-containing protein
MKGLSKYIRKGHGIKMSFDLHSTAAAALNNGHYFEAAIIYFQLVELQLRLTLFLLGTRASLSKSVIKKVIENEDKFKVDPFVKTII